MQLYQTEIIKGDRWTFSTIPGLAPNSLWQVLIADLFDQGFDPTAHFFIDFIGHYSCDRMDEEFAWDDLSACVRENKGKKIHVIFDAHTEAPSFGNLRALAERIRSRFGIGFQRMVLWGGGDGGKDCPIRVARNLNAFSLVTNVSLLQVWPRVTQHFSMLARMPKLHRIIAAVDIIERGLDSFGTVTCGSAGPDHHDPTFYHNVVPRHLVNKFPLLIDGIVPAYKQHDVMLIPQVQGSFCQLIPETSYEFLYPGWSTIFPTEKSEKCFLMGHVPIFIAPAGQVKYLRSMGFDMMDDIIDHGYDTEDDHLYRIRMAVDQLELICQKPLSDLSSWRNANLHRLIANQDLCFKLRDNFWVEASARLSAAMT